MSTRIAWFVMVHHKPAQLAWLMNAKPRVDDRRVLSDIVFVNRNGLRWRDAPAAYGPPKTLYSYTG